jgi:hypothetical protein
MLETTDKHAYLLPMLSVDGYVQTNTLEHWQKESQARVQNEAKELKLERMETSVKFESAFPLEWASTHRREKTGPVRLIHLLLDCRKT